MKIKERALALLLTLAMVLTFMPAAAFAGSTDGDDSDIDYEYDDEYEYEFGDIPASCQSISSGQEKTVILGEEDTEVTYSFTPSKSGIYVFRSDYEIPEDLDDPDDETDPVGRVVIRNGSGIEEIGAEDDSFEDDYNFRIIFAAEQGKTYYLQAGAWNEMTVTFSVSLQESQVRGMALVLCSPDEPRELYEGFYMDEDDDRIFDYNEYDLFEEGDMVYVFYKDGLTVDNLEGKTEGEDYDIYEATFTEDDDLVFLNLRDEELQYSLEDSQGDPDYWTASDDPYQVIFSCMGFEDTIDVYVRSNPVDSIAFRPAYSEDGVSVYLHAEDIYETYTFEGEEYSGYNLCKRGRYDSFLNGYEGFVSGDVLSVTFKEGSGFSDGDYTYDPDTQNFYFGEEELPLFGPSYDVTGFSDTDIISFIDTYENGEVCSTAEIEYAGKTVSANIIVVDGKHVHDLDEGTIITQPTTSAEGLKTCTCRYCGETVNVAIAKLPSPPAVQPAAPAAQTEIQDLPAVKISKPKAAKKKVTVKWKKVNKKNLKKIQGIEIRVAGPGVDKTVTAGKKKTSKKVGGLMPKQKYTVQVRAYAWIGGVKHVSAWKTKSVKVK